MKKLLLLLGVVVLSASVSAQVSGPLGTGEVQQQVTADMSPLYPEAGETVEINLTAYGTNLNAAQITWSVDGKQEQNGVGITKFSTTAGDNGKIKRVTVVIQPTGQPTITKNFLISSQEVSIIYEADSYVPPFYKGKGLFNREGRVRFVAMPNLVSSTGVRLNPANLIYTWKINGTVQGSKSGYGVNSYVHTDSILGQAVRVEVEVSSADGTVKGKGLTITSAQASEVLAYEKDPLYGTLFNRELSSGESFLKEKEVVIKAEPYFISAAKAVADNLQYSWTINGLSIPVPAGQDHIVLRNPDGGKGSSLIGVAVNNTTNLLQRTSNSLTISY